MFSYAGPVFIYLFCRRDAVSGDGRAQWTLRSASKPLAGAGVAFSALFMVVICWPTVYPVTACESFLSLSSLVGWLVAQTLLIDWVWVWFCAAAK